MNTHLLTSTYDQKSQGTVHAKRTASLDVMISSGIQEIDNALGGFKAGTITYIHGSNNLISSLAYRLCVTTYQMFNGCSIFIDGGTTVNPYRIARYAQQCQLPPKDVLSHVYISRAFTLYQLTTLIHESLEPMIQQRHPQALIIHAFSYLYQDVDVCVDESLAVLKTSMETLKRLTRTYQLVTILSMPSSHLTNRYDLLQRTVVSKADEMLHITIPHHCPRVSFLHHPQSITLTSYAEGQLSLRDFGMVM